MNTDKITKALCEICKAATNNDHSAPDWFEKLKDAENTLKAVDDILSFNEYEREKGDPDNTLEEMEYLDELAQCGGDWSKPSYILMRAFYGHRYSRFANEPEHKKEEFNPNDEYFTFNRMIVKARNATREEYAPLLTELRSIYRFTDFEITNRN